jgi:hypothetical protein
MLLGRLVARVDSEGLYLHRRLVIKTAPIGIYAVARAKAHPPITVDDEAE